nr:hypothetical protein [Pseudomonas sp. BN102]
MLNLPEMSQLHASVQKLFRLPDSTRVFVGHDYKAPGRDEYQCETTIGVQRRHNLHIREGISEDDFVCLRNARDINLNMPALMLPAIQTNIRAGHFPAAESNGVSYLKIPLDVF